MAELPEHSGLRIDQNSSRAAKEHGDSGPARCGRRGGLPAGFDRGYAIILYAYTCILVDICGPPVGLSPPAWYQGMNVIAFRYAHRLAYYTPKASDTKLILGAGPALRRRLLCVVSALFYVVYVLYRFLLGTSGSISTFCA